MSCSRKVLENQTAAQDNQTECVNKNIQCDLKDEEIIGSIYCSSGTLMSKSLIFCNSTTLLNGTNVNETTTILNCYEGQLPESQAAFIPTTTTTQRPTTTTEKSLSFGAKIHMFFLRVIGKSDSADKTITTTPVPEVTTIKDSWVPEALTIPPETTISPEISTIAPNTTEGPFKWMEKVPIKYENGTHGITIQPVSKLMVDMHEGSTYPPHWFKVNATEPIETSTATASSSSDGNLVSSESPTTEEPKNN